MPCTFGVAAEDIGGFMPEEAAELTYARPGVAPLPILLADGQRDGGNSRRILMKLVGPCGRYPGWNRVNL